MIYVIARTAVPHELLGEVLDCHKACIAETHKEKGCLSYHGPVRVIPPNLYVVVERWESRYDLNAHGKAPHMKVWRGESVQLKTGPPGEAALSRGEGGKV